MGLLYSAGGKEESEERGVDHGGSVTAGGRGERRRQWGRLTLWWLDCRLGGGEEGKRAGRRENEGGQSEKKVNGEKRGWGCAAKRGMAALRKRDGCERRDGGDGN